MRLVIIFWALISRLTNCAIYLKSLKILPIFVWKCAIHSFSKLPNLFIFFMFLNKNIEQHRPSYTIIVKMPTQNPLIYYTRCKKKKHQFYSVKKIVCTHFSSIFGPLCGHGCDIYLYAQALKRVWCYFFSFGICMYNIYTNYNFPKWIWWFYTYRRWKLSILDFCHHRHTIIFLLSF